MLYLNTKDDVQIAPENYITRRVLVFTALVTLNN